MMMTSKQYWQSEVKRLEEKFANSKEFADKVQLTASRIMLDPTHVVGFDMATEHALVTTSAKGCVTASGDVL
jgi:hypothetical protein